MAIDQPKIMGKGLWVLLALTLGLSGCQRDTSTPAKTLLGHWRNEKGQNWCFDANGSMTTYAESLDGMTRTRWAIVSESPKSKSIEIVFSQEKNPLGFKTVFAFSSDGQQARVTESLTGMELFNFRYMGQDTKACGSDRG